MKATRLMAVMCVALSGALALGSVALAAGKRAGQRWQGHGGQRMRAGAAWRAGQKGGGEHILRMKEKLGLTDEQAAKFKDVSAKYKDGIAAAREKVGEAHRALRAAADSQDTAAIRKAAADLGSAIGDRAVLLSEVCAERHAVLTPEQLDKLKAFRETRKKAWTERRSSRKGRHGRGPLTQPEE